MVLLLLVQRDAVVEEELSAPTPLLRPAAGIPHVVDHETAFREAIAALAQGSGPFALDAERASGYKYSARAYLIQIKRTGGGLHLIDPMNVAARDLHLLDPATGNAIAHGGQPA